MSAGQDWSESELARLRAEIQALPKVELHRHMEGAMRLSTLCEYYCVRELNLPLDLVLNVLTRRRANGNQAEAKGDDSAAENDAKVPPQADLEAKVIEHYCHKAPTDSLIAFLDKFEHTRQLFNTLDVVERNAFECVEDSYNEGTRVLEMRYSPSYIVNGHKRFTFEEVHKAVMAGVARATAKYGIAVGLIAILDRSLPVKETEEEYEFVLKNRQDFVGIDLANDEASHPCLQFKHIFADAAAKGLRITVHSGEVPTDKAPEWVWQSISQLHAERIGHGFNVMRDLELAKKIVQDHKTVFEVCPSSNYLCKGVPSVAEHPMKKMFDLGLLVTLNTDDPGMFLCTMNSEIELAVTVLGFTMDDIKTMMQTAYRASFIPDDVKAKYWPSDVISVSV